MHFCSWLHCQGVTTGTCTSNTSHPRKPLGLYDNCQSSLLRLTNGERKSSSLVSLDTQSCLTKRVIGTQRTAIDNRVMVLVLFLCYSKQIYLVCDFCWGGDKMSQQISGLKESTNFYSCILVYIFILQNKHKKGRKNTLIVMTNKQFLTTI